MPEPGSSSPRSGGLRERWRRLTALGVPPRYPVAQVPNAPALVAIAASLVGRVSDGTPGAVALGVFVVALAAWGWWELTDGANVVRRLLGAGGLAYAAWRVVAVAG